MFFEDTLTGDIFILKHEKRMVMIIFDAIILIVLTL